MFSPYYARAHRRGAADPGDHCALNVALYRERGKRWAMTEHGRRHVRVERDRLAIGRSRLHWDGGTLIVDIDEMAVPLPTRIRGRVTLRPAALNAAIFPLDAAGRHQWRPIAPLARAEVRLDHPSFRWSGDAYLDSNRGDEPLADGFAEWDWSRAALPDGTAVVYDMRRRDGSHHRLAVRFAADGSQAPIALLAPAALPLTGWRIRRNTLADPGAVPHVLRTLEDTPFYARSLLRTRLLGADALAVHESLSLDRFRLPIVQWMLPFRMPRRGGSAPAAFRSVER